MARFFAMTSRGLSDILFKEISDLGLSKVLKGQGGVYFESNWAGCYRANIRLRTATRILLPILDFPAYNPEELYNNIRKHDFTKYIEVGQTLAVDANIRECGIFRDQRFVAMKIKDAIVDQFNEKFGARPDVDSKNPSLTIVVRAIKNQFAVSIDTSGEPLFKRGYKNLKMVTAPLKEHLAAGLILATEWKKDIPIVDPMCGGATFLIEAALIALNISPGTLRKRFAFQNFIGFKPEEFKEELELAMSEELEELPFKFYGYDIDRDAIKIAQSNVHSAGLDEYIEIGREPIETLPAPCPMGVMVVNPPYGERLGTRDELEDLYLNMAHTMKTAFKGWDCWILSGEPELTQFMKLKAERRFPVMNGPIECRFLKYKMF
jgi:23S rRNA G2445 N2-methylase RlmL